MQVEEQTGRLNRLRVRQNGQVLGCVNPGSEELSFRLFRPSVHPLYTPSGVPVTEQGAHNYPHHKGIWIGHGNVSGVDFYTEHPIGPDRPIGVIVTTATRYRTDPDEARLTLDLEWRGPDFGVLLREVRTLRFTLAESATILDVMSSVVPAGDPVELAEEKHGFLAVRVLDAIDEDDGGVMQDAAGRIGEAETHGSAEPWVDCSGMVGRQAVGITLMVHPESPPGSFFTRAYGCIQADHFFDRSLGLAPGERLVQRFRVVAHDGDAAAFDIAGAYADFAGESFLLPPVA